MLFDCIFEPCATRRLSAESVGELIRHTTNHVIRLISNIMPTMIPMFLRLQTCLGYPVASPFEMDESRCRSLSTRSSASSMEDIFYLAPDAPEHRRTILVN